MENSQKSKAVSQRKRSVPIEPRKQSFAKNEISTNFEKRVTLIRVSKIIEKIDDL